MALPSLASACLVCTNTGLGFPFLKKTDQVKVYINNIDGPGQIKVLVKEGSLGGNPAVCQSWGNPGDAQDRAGVPAYGNR